MGNFEVSDEDTNGCVDVGKLVTSEYACTIMIVLCDSHVDSSVPAAPTGSACTAPRLVSDQLPTCIDIDIDIVGIVIVGVGIAAVAVAIAVVYIVVGDCL